MNNESKQSQITCNKEPNITVTAFQQRNTNYTHTKKPPRDDLTTKLPNIKRNMQKEQESQQIETTFLRSLSASSFSLSDFNQNEFKFWEGLVFNFVGSSVSEGLSNEDRKLGLKLLRKKALLIFLSANRICVIALVGFYAFSMQTLGSKSTFSIVMGLMLSLSPIIQISSSNVYRIIDILNRIGRWINTVT
ncbi:unnamed protein product [Mytilus coruscus]|uniref:Uncharacterized protein n=1 Tax=Mytilus coruscus TaxID=42192 RepID=A0A6J8BY52_MYTCO|nr:unnamed protein product [Mytilus coruscus]